MISRKRLANYYGKYSEWLACLYLMLKGYRFLKHDYATKYGQIDLVFYKKNTVVFVEVKARKKMAVIENIISRQQRRHAISAANHFVLKNKFFTNKAMQFDAIYVIGLFRILHFKHIYEDL